MAAGRKHPVFARLRRTGYHLGESDVGDYLNNFPTRRLTAPTDPQRFPIALAEASVEAVLETAVEVDELDAFLAETETQSLIVIHDDEVVLERYYNRGRRDSMVTSFSAFTETWATAPSGEVGAAALDI